MAKSPREGSNVPANVARSLREGFDVVEINFYEVTHASHRLRWAITRRPCASRCSRQAIGRLAMERSLLVRWLTRDCHLQWMATRQLTWGHRPWRTTTRSLPIGWLKWGRYLQRVTAQGNSHGVITPSERSHEETSQRATVKWPELALHDRVRTYALLEGSE